MKCSACSKAMVALELRGVEVDYCPACRSAWLDRGELQELLPPGALAAAWSGWFRAGKAGEKKKRCPICRVRMDKKEFNASPPVCLDVCPRDHGIWFDPGELGEVLKARAPEGGGEVVGLLKDIFGTRTV